MDSIFIRQIDEIRKGGSKAIPRIIRKVIVKATKLPINLVGYFLGVPMVLLVRFIRPLVLIRFGSIRSDVIGHFTIDSEYYLSEKEILKTNTLDLFYFQSNPQPNDQWALMVKRHMRVNEIFRSFDNLNRLIPGWEVHHKVVGDIISKDLKGYFAKTKPHIAFTTGEKDKGQSFLRSLGMYKREKFICLIVRDSAYKEKYLNWGNRDWSYHNYRDSDIDTYEEATLTMAEKGYWVFRMGKAVNKPLAVNHPRILDYANSPYRSDFLDIWLMANCFFCISTGIGLDCVCGVFRKPVLNVNLIPWSHVATASFHWYENYYKILKKSNNEPLSLNEAIELNYISLLRTEDFVKHGLTIIDNSSGEIKEAVLSFEERLSNNRKGNGCNSFNKEYHNILSRMKNYRELYGEQPPSNLSPVFIKRYRKSFLLT